MDLIMAVAKKDKIKALQVELKAHPELKEVLAKVTQVQVEAIEQVVADVLVSLAKTDKVKFADVGTFETRETAARKGVNPAKLKELKEQGVDAETAKEQATIDIAASSKLAFSQSAAMKSELN